MAILIEGKHMAERDAIDVMRKANGCDLCFRTIAGLSRARPGLPKPRWIGEKYFAARPRVVIALINPGSGNDLPPSFHRREEELFQSFYATGDYRTIRDYFRERFAGERHGEYRRPVFTWYEDVFGLKFEEIAQINIAWCADEGNQHPKSMLRSCFERHTSALLAALEPNAVLLSGSNLASFEPAIRASLPNVRVRTILHYAHRGGKAAERVAGESVRQWLAEVRAGVTS